MSCLGGKTLETIVNEKLPMLSGSELAKQLSHERPEQELLVKFLTSDARVLEFGAGQGCTAVLIDKLIRDPSAHVVIDPSEYAVKCTEDRKRLTNSNFTIYHAFLAKSRVHQETLWDDCKSVRNIAKLEDLQIDFNTISADCEGAFLHICRDFPELLMKAQLVFLENDGGKQNQAETEELLVENNFVCVHSQCHPYLNTTDIIAVKTLQELRTLAPKHVGFHQVWVKK